MAGRSTTEIIMFNLAKIKNSEPAEREREREREREALPFLSTTEDLPFIIG